MFLEDESRQPESESGAPENSPSDGASGAPNPENTQKDTHPRV